MDCPVIFLGQWCTTFGSRHVWGEMDAIVAQPYGLGVNKKKSDQLKIKKIEFFLFEVLIKQLNEIHECDHSDRFWRIVLGHWLERYVRVIFNRVKTIEQCIAMHRVSGITLLRGKDLIPKDSFGGILGFIDNNQNCLIAEQVIRTLYPSIPIDFIIENDIKDDKFSKKTISAIAPYVANKSFHWFTSKINHLLSREGDAFIINSCLPLFEEVKLQVGLRQLPKIWTPINYQDLPEKNLELRIRMSNEVRIEAKSQLEEILLSIVFRLLPICFLEGFSTLNKIVSSVPWPKNPKFIFTSNSFDTDEVFKVWAAKKIEGGAKYYVGQHGNNYGTSQFMNPSIEESTSDKFLTWGWRDKLPNQVPAFALIKNQLKIAQYNHDGGLLLVELLPAQRMTTWDDTAEFNLYFNSQIAFVNELKRPIRDKLTIRLFLCPYETNGFELERWRSFDDQIKIDIGSSKIHKLIEKNRITVFSYDSTGMLETLSSNIPTILFWQNGLDHLRESVKPFYLLLIDAGILYLTPEAAAHKVNEVWEDVDIWWFSDLVQNARKLFCEKYSKQSADIAGDLLKIISN